MAALEPTCWRQYLGVRAQMQHVCYTCIYLNENKQDLFSTTCSYNTRRKTAFIKEGLYKGRSLREAHRYSG